MGLLFRYFVFGLLTVIAACTLACDWSDQRTWMGALRAATDAADRSDAPALYRVLDQRGRFAMDSTVRYRKKSARLISQFYPDDLKYRALDDLGDARFATNGESLFASRCGTVCMRRLRAQLGTALSIHTQDRITHVTTQRGGDVFFYKDSHNHYGLVWHTEALEAERTQASRDLGIIEHNVKILKRRRALGYSLEQDARTEPPS